MRLVVIQCDNCRKQVPAPGDPNIFFAPPSWLVLLQEGCETQHFCSLLCLKSKTEKIFHVENRLDMCEEGKHD